MLVGCGAGCAGAALGVTEACGEGARAGVGALGFPYGTWLWRTKPPPAFALVPLVPADASASSDGVPAASVAAGAAIAAFGAGALTAFAGAATEGAAEGGGSGGRIAAGTGAVISCPRALL